MNKGSITENIIFFMKENANKDNVSLV